MQFWASEKIFSDQSFHSRLAKPEKLTKIQKAGTKIAPAS
jgi:hypothetical protein